KPVAPCDSETAAAPRRPRWCPRGLAWAWELFKNSSGIPHVGQSCGIAKPEEAPKTGCHLAGTVSGFRRLIAGTRIALHPWHADRSPLRSALDGGAAYGFRPCLGPPLRQPAPAHRDRSVQPEWRRAAGGAAVGQALHALLAHRAREA